MAAALKVRALGLAAAPIGATLLIVVVTMSVTMSEYNASTTDVG